MSTTNEHKLLIFDTLSSAVPSIIGAFFSFMQETINLIFIGRLNDPILLAAVGMGNIAINMLGVAVFMGMNGSLDTLVSQAFGAKDIRLCGVYLNRGRWVVTIIFIPIFGMFLISGTILKAFGQNEQVANQAQNYILSYSPGIYLMALFDLQRRFLIHTGHSQR